MNPYYIYALKDPRNSPAKPFYIGKGTGNRAWEHTIRVDSTAKGRRIAEIQSSGTEVVVTILADDLSESQALKLEAELISAFGTESTGGLLTNSVVPSGMIAESEKLILPAGIVEKAQIALGLLKDAVYEFACANETGVTNADVAKYLGLQSNYGGGSKDFLSYSILGLLMEEGKVQRVNPTKRHIAIR